MYYIILYNILYKINNFFLAKIKVILPLIKPISKKKSLYIDIPDKKNPTSINEKILNKSKIIKMLDIKPIIPKNKYITSSIWSKIEIKFI